MRDKNSIDFSDSLWSISESGLDKLYFGKYEVLMALGNGYLGCRSIFDECYLGQTPNMFVAGTYNKATESEVSELPNMADMILTELEINHQRLNLETCMIEDYQRKLDIRTGLLTRSFIWEIDQKHHAKLIFKRFVSMHEKHLLAQTVMIQSLKGDLDVKIISAINGQVTNSGAQHFIEGEKRVIDQKYMQFCQQTSQTSINVVQSSTLKFNLNNESFQPHVLFRMDRRKLDGVYTFKVASQAIVTVEKYSTIHTSRDWDFRFDLSLKQKSLDTIKQVSQTSFDELLTQSAHVWDKEVWSAQSIEIESSNPFDQLAIRFAQYHLSIMTPTHDERMSIAAKGLTGEGYKGHVFWDTEIFILPYYSYTRPEIARNLLMYRYHSLVGARNKAKENGYQGAMYPWESAWIDEGEVTPVWGAADLVTGEQTKILSGFIEQHITADIVYAIDLYYRLTHDEEFMRNHGYEIILETTRFWVSRLEWSNDDQKYHINCVVGPDEYKEEVDDNAFTNHLAAYNIKYGLYIIEKLKGSKLLDYLAIDSDEIHRWYHALANMYLPEFNEEGILPQDNTYLTKKNIDLTKYKKQKHVGGLFLDYNLDQVNQLQVSKQADVVLLMLLMNHEFSHEDVKRNFDYYEPRTLHDSSLSLSSHTILACDLGLTEYAYDLFERAARIDLGRNMQSSDHGIHSASLGGIWQSIVLGFGGVRLFENDLTIRPNLPKQWKKLSFTIVYLGQKILVFLTPKQALLSNLGAQDVPLSFNGQTIVLEAHKQMSISY